MENPHRRKPRFSVQDFKNWLAQGSQQKDLIEFFNISQPATDADRFIGKEVKAKVSAKKLLEKIEPEEGDAETLVTDLLENGGMILSIRDKNLLVEVETGSFYIPRFCVRIRKDG